MSQAEWTPDIIYMTEDILDERDIHAKRRNYFVILGIVLVVFWIIYDFILMEAKDFEIAHRYSFIDKTTREVGRSMTEESRRLLSGADEEEQISGFVHIIERNRYLLYKNQINLESYYDFIDNILYPKQKNSLKDKGEYAFQVSKYLRKIRRTQFEYAKYEMAKPEFYYEDYTRNARVLLVRTSVEGSKEYHTHYFRKYKGRYYLYLK